MKYVTNADILLFDKPVEASDAKFRVDAGTEFESDGVIITANMKGTTGGQLTFLAADVPNVGKGYVLSIRAEKVSG